MNFYKNILLSACLGATFALAASAQTNVVTVTNIITVTVLVTNVVTVTNVVASTPAPLLVPAAVAAPVKVVKYPWNSSISAGLTLNRGDSDTTLFSADFLTEKKTPKDEYSLGAGLAYGEQASQDTVNNYKMFSQWNHLFTPRFYNYLRVGGLRDYIADLNYRVTVGPGVGYYLLKTTNTTLATEGGFNFEAQKLGGHDQNFATLRLADRFEHKFNDRARLWQMVEIFPQLDKFDNYVMNFEIGMEAVISKSFSLKTTLDDTYDNRPAANHLKNNAKIVAGVAYKF
jgi:putative salt-induced outer membrane protein